MGEVPVGRLAGSFIIADAPCAPTGQLALVVLARQGSRHHRWVPRQQQNMHCCLNALRIKVRRGIEHLYPPNPAVTPMSMMVMLVSVMRDASMMCTDQLGEGNHQLVQAFDT